MSGEEVFYAIVDSSREPTPLTTVALLAGISRKRALKLVRSAPERFYSWKEGRTRYVSTKPRSPRALTQQQQHILFVLRAFGPHSSSQLATRLRARIPRGTFATLKQHGVVQTRMGRSERVWSLGALPEAFREIIVRARKERRAEADRRRRERKQDGLTVAENDLVRDALASMTDTYFERYRYNVPAAHEYLVLQRARVFAKWVTRALVVSELRVARARGQPDLTPQRLAQVVIERHVRSFAESVKRHETSPPPG